MGDVEHFTKLASLRQRSVYRSTSPTTSKDLLVRNVLRPTPNPSLYGGGLLSFSFLIGYAYISLPREGRGGLEKHSARMGL